MIEVFVFDIGNVVWNYQTLFDELYLKWANHLGRSLEDFKKEYLSVYQDLETGKLSTQVWLKSLSLQKYPNLYQSIDDTFSDTIRFNSYFNREVLSIISDLKKRNYQVGCLTNSEDFFYPYQLSHIFPYFDFSIASWQTGFRKPSQDIYHHIFNFGSWRSENIFFIDDKQNNVSAAQELGFYTHHFRDSTRLLSNINSVLTST